MSENLSRRTAMGLGAAAAAAATVGLASPASAAAASPAAAPATKGPDAAQIRKTYYREKPKAGGFWHSHIAMINSAGTLQTIVEDDPDFVVHGYSVQKLAVATAVMDKIDRGQLTLGTRLDLQADIILDGSGIYFLHGVYGDEITVANFLTALLLVSDNTAVRMCGRVVPALEINEILAAKGFVKTRVEPVTNPNRFFLGVTTPREMHDLLWRLANKTLLSASSCDFLLRILCGLSGYHDGVRHNFSSRERERTASKYGADFNTLGESRHEVGLMFDVNGVPTLTYSMFAEGLGDPENYGATHPAVKAHAVIGRTMRDTVNALALPSSVAVTRAKQKLIPFKPVNAA